MTEKDLRDLKDWTEKAYNLFSDLEPWVNTKGDGQWSQGMHYLGWVKEKLNLMSLGAGLDVED